MFRVNPQSLRQRLVIQIGLMIIGLVVLSAGAIVGINGLHHDFGDALRGYRQLRAVYEIGLNVASAKLALREGSLNTQAAKASIEEALIKFDAGEPIEDPQLRADLQEALQTLQPPPIESAMSRLANLSAGIRASIVARQQAADQKREVTLAIVIGLGISVVAAGVVLGVRQYRSVMRPLRRLSEAARAMAEGNFPHGVDPSSRDREFTQLAQDFNYMAGELESLYRELERKVAAKSKELVRSERLASVGYLAAGVAHEINNPLSIITGYGERALQQLDRDPDSAIAADRARQAIGVMCEEAYRCKQITDRLLSLARPGSENRAPVSMRVIADEVISGISGLPEYRNRKIVIESNASDDLIVLAKDGEMKQVILNLLINAAQAVDANSGLIRVTISRQKDEIEMAVADNGRGMDAQMLDRVFEPFFTQKRGVGDRPGTGLGLSITHAIIADHGGAIAAESDGLGRGSRFVVRLPAMKIDEQGAGYVNR